MDESTNRSECKTSAKFYVKYATDKVSGLRFSKSNILQIRVLFTVFTVIRYKNPTNHQYYPGLDVNNQIAVLH